MKLLASLALKDLLRERMQLLCNVAVLAGVLVPLLVLLGVKNGVYDALIGRLLSDPAALQIDTSGNQSFRAEDAEEVRGWPEAGFVTLKTRSLFDFVNVREVGGRGKRDAILVPSGTGDPTLDGRTLGPGEAILSAGLAEQLSLAAGAEIQVITQASDRPRQLALPLTVVAVLPPERLAGRALLTDIAVLDMVEAFYDAYALPEYGIAQGRDMAERVADFEGMRVFARDLTLLAPLQTRIEQRFNIRTEARTAEVAGVLNLGRNLDLALVLTASVASIGLAAALVFGFWSEVARKRRVLATLALMGLPSASLWVFPVIQALACGLIGLAVSFGLFLGAARVAEALFAGGMPEGQRLVTLSPVEIGIICAGVLVFVTATALFAARAAARADPASVLREGAA
ncbi:ABC transporter permease [Dinoroseobacter sp. PD6]|uniref:FtsX-like permease family protein n=1 Tax=Dinoroseobacter sp. PD6 TaxID=3028384 RepID=UPI00237A37D6|nr:FtsX-like permease family protein [Dinoroseobacter sp. PD6]MDD9718398.1 ABC transporter permease [Dinoroseobacter sp. PD6]